jgi:hypothetical protein
LAGVEARFDAIAALELEPGFDLIGGLAGCWASAELAEAKNAAKKKTANRLAGKQRVRAAREAT